MKKMGWLVTGALLAGGVVFARGGCLNASMKAPDQKLASQYKDLCGIAHDGAKNPVRGVRKLGVYLTKNGGAMLDNFASTIAVIERIHDDEKHDDRARLARQRWEAVACSDDWQAFDEAINESPEAQEMIGAAVQRMARTFEIILGPTGMPAGLQKLLHVELPARRLGTQARGAARADVAKP